jgi:serine/threonine-protein kinase
MINGAPRDELIGMKFGKEGRLVVQESLCSGGIGSVYIALDERRQRKVAIKFLRPEFTGSKEVIERFKREGKRFASLAHPNIINVYGLGREHGLLYIALEFVEGRNLAETLVEDGAFELSEALDICRDVASALHAAHEQNIVHRDLKPENIMIRADDKRVKVLDFGIAKSLDSGSLLTQKGAYVGTPGYSAPEQIKGLEVDHRADIFPLGAILYEMLTGKLAFDGRHTTQVLASSLRDRPVPVIKVGGISLKPVGKLIERMLQKRASRRFQSMQEVVGAIDEIKASLGSLDDSEKAGMVASLKRMFEL